MTAIGSVVTEWVAALPITGTVAEVLERYRVGARVEDARHERVRAEQLAAHRERLQDMADLARPRGTSLPSCGDVLMRVRVATELADAAERSAAEKAADERALQAERRVLALQKQLAEEQRGHRRTAQHASRAVDGWAAERRRVDESRRVADEYYQRLSYR